MNYSKSAIKNCLASVFECLSQQLAGLPAQQHYLIAYSGGLDSHSLLKLMSLWRTQNSSISLTAVHVHHGLNPQADYWVEHCRRIASELQITFYCEYLDSSPPRGSSVEAWARESRYAALAKYMQKNSVLLTAHTQDDQAETVLLQLLRGSGPKGLAAMPQQQPFASGLWIRPFLNLSRSCLQTFAQQQALSWIEDESNAELRFDRNFIRHRIIPILRERWPEFSKNVARSAQHNAEAAINLNELALADLQGKNVFEPLSINLLKNLPAGRQRNLLRFWLGAQGCQLPNTRQMQRILQDLIHSRDDSQPQINWGECSLRRFRQHLFICRYCVPIEKLAPIPWDLSSPLQLPYKLGQLEVTQTHHGGLALNLNRQALTIQFRQGGERCRLAGRAQSSLLKKLFQEWKIPPWERAFVPLLFHGDELAAVIGYGVCASFAATEGELGWMIGFKAAKLMA